MTTVYGIRYSPWSLRARWALGHHGVEYDYVEFVPMVTTPLVRAKLRDFRGKITVPILIDGTTILRDSLDIARWADERGSGGSLFADDPEVVVAWSQTANEIAEAGRVITTYATLSDPEARRQSVPKPLRRVAGPMMSIASRYLADKYEFDEATVDASREQMRRALERVANRLVQSDVLGETFGWPDITVAAALQFVRPADSWVRFGKSARAAWTRPELAAEFEDVLRWRDDLLGARLGDK